MFLKHYVCVFHAQSLATDLAEQVRTERVRLEMQIKQAAAKALHAIQKWYGHCCQNILVINAVISMSFVKDI